MVKNSRWLRVILPALVVITLLNTGAAVAGPIYWDQVQSFNLSGHPDPLIRYENGSMSGSEAYVQSASLTFQGAPPTSFKLAGHSYSLTAASVFLTSNFHAQYGVGAYDSDWFSDAAVEGSVSTDLKASIKAPFFSTLAEETYPSGQLAASATDNWLLPIAWLLGEEWFNFGQASVGKQIDVNTSINATIPFDPNLFLHEKELTVSFDKAVSLALTYYIPDDNWDAVASPVNNWQGTMTLRYSYEEIPGAGGAAPPVPLPSSGLLFLSGFGIVAALGRKFKRTTSMTILTVLVLAGMLSGSPAAADTMTWVQTQTFSLANTAANTSRYNRSTTARQDYAWAFQGAPQEFMRLGSLYKLDGISFQLESTFTGHYHLHAQDDHWYRTCGAAGTSSTDLSAYLNMFPEASFFGSSPTGTPLGNTVYTYNKAIYGDWTMWGSVADDYQSPVIAVNKNFTIDPSLFPTFDKLAILFSLAKDIQVNLTYYNEDDEAQWMYNDVNKWEATVTITYRYAEAPVPPVPAPGTLWLFLPGLISIAFVRKRVSI